MIDVHVEQIDNVWARVVCEDSIAQELSDFFTFAVPNAHFSPQYKSKYWDGKIRLFSTKTHKIYVGLIPYVGLFCKENDYTFSHMVFKGIPLIAKTEHIQEYGIPLKPFEYQYAGFLHALNNKRSVIVSPTASGKSLMIYMIVRWLLSNGRKRGLLIVPTTSLVEQMNSDFASYGWNVAENCNMVYYGKDKFKDAKLTISTWQSIYDMPKPFFKAFDFVIGDEAHQFKADSLKKIMTGLVNCDYRIGTTGTLDDSKVHKLVLEGLFGPVKKVANSKDLMGKQLATLSIECVVLKYPEEVCKSVKGFDYVSEMDFLIGNPRRNNFIANLAGVRKGNTLVLYTYVDKHGKVLYDLIKTKFPNRKVFFVCGDTEALEREEVRRITEQEKDAIIVASYGTFSTGTNIRNLHNAILASPSKSKIRVLQSLGRILRLGDNKTSATLFDIADDLRYKSYTNFTLKHYEERIKIYNGEKFNFKTHNIGIGP